MTLNKPQWLWLIAVIALIATIIADIAGIMQVPPIYWLIGSVGLMVIGWRVMPMSDVEAAWRKQNRR